MSSNARCRGRTALPTPEGHARELRLTGRQTEASRFWNAPRLRRIALDKAVGAIADRAVLRAPCFLPRGYIVAATER